MNAKRAMASGKNERLGQGKDVHAVVYVANDGVILRDVADLLAGLAGESQKYDGQTVAEFLRSFLFDSQMTRITRSDFLTSPQKCNP